MEGLREGYDFFARQAGAGVAAIDSDQWVSEVEEAVDKFAKDMASFSGSAKKVQILAGDVAEFWHADTFNINAAVHRSVGPRAEVPRVNGYGSPDVVLGDIKYQLKYYKNAEASIRAQSWTFGQDAHAGRPSAQALVDSGLVGPNDPVYGDMERLIPTDQVDEAGQALERRIATESARRPEQVGRYQSTKDHLTGNVKDDNGNSSMDLSRSDANELARDAKSGELDLRKWGLSLEQVVQIEDILKQALRAGLSAAALAAALEAAPAIIGLAQHLIDEGELDADELSRVGESTARGGARGFFVGAITAAVTDAARLGMLGEAAESVSPTVIGAFAVVAYNTLRNAARVARGEMERAELINALGRDSFVATCSLIAAGVGQGLVQIPVVGYLLGSLVGSAVGGVTWAVAENATLALCVDSGVTLFGLVDQNYELPPEVAEQIGAEVFDYERFIPEHFEPESFEPVRFEPDEFEAERFGITQLRRGVFGVARVGYSVA